MRDESAQGANSIRLELSCAGISSRSRVGCCTRLTSVGGCKNHCIRLRDGGSWFRRRWKRQRIQHRAEVSRDISLKEGCAMSVAKIC